MKHALVVGGTGMLSGVSLWLVEQGYHVSIIARHSWRMEQLMNQTIFPNHITPLLVDYRHDNALRRQVNDTIINNGNIDVVVAWIHHSVANNALSIIVNEVAKNQDEWELFHVLGSSSNLASIKQKAAVPDNCLYYQVQLGFVKEATYSRWLTNEEISSGVIEALQTKKAVHIVGQLEPWEDRP